MVLLAVGEPRLAVASSPWSPDRHQGKSLDSVPAPCIFVIGGPNGAGKSTTAPGLLRDRFNIRHYVNADTIAAGLSAFNPEAAAFRAGRIMLDQLHDLCERRANFAFETTLSTKGYARWLKKSQESGYRVYLLFLALPNAEAALNRVARRVSLGGHDVLEEVVRRRFDRGLTNFFQLYRPLANRWFLSDNGGRKPKLLAHGGIGRDTVEKSPIYQTLEERYGSRRHRP